MPDVSALTNNRAFIREGETRKLGKVGINSKRIKARMKANSKEVEGERKNPVGER